MVNVDAYDATKTRKKRRGIATLVELPSEEPPSVDGVVLDPGPESWEIEAELIKCLDKSESMNIS